LESQCTAAQIVECSILQNMEFLAHPHLWSTPNVHYIHNYPTNKCIPTGHYSEQTKAWFLFESFCFGL